VSSVDLWPDVEGALRTWLRDDPTMLAVVNRRVFFGVPAQGALFPLITISRVGGGENSSEAAIDEAAIQFSVWGQARADCTAAMLALRAALHKIRGRTALTGAVTAYGATINSVVWQPDPADARPRFIVTALVTAIAT
jgi:Protein of unknown function (DUF3168)